MYTHTHCIITESHVGSFLCLKVDWNYVLVKIKEKEKGKDGKREWFEGLMGEGEKYGYLPRIVL